MAKLINIRRILALIRANTPAEDTDFTPHAEDAVDLELWRKVVELQTQLAAGVKMGENVTGALEADTLYRIKFTTINHVSLMTYANAKYILTAIDPATGNQVFCETLSPGDTVGYSAINSFKIKVLKNLPDGLIIRHIGI